MQLTYGPFVVILCENLKYLTQAYQHYNIDIMQRILQMSHPYVAVKDPCYEIIYGVLAL